jgi:alpha-ribazole phosphatase
MKKQLTLVRHGALETSLDGCYVGRLDVELGATGVRQAKQLANCLKNRGIDGLWCSPALRAVETSAPIAKQLKLTASNKNDLDEVDFGRWEGLTFEQISSTDPHLVAKWSELAEDFCFPEGESHVEFQQRVARVVEDINSSELTSIALVTHGGVIRSLICQLLGYPYRDRLKFEILRGGFVTFDLYSQGAVLTGLYNEPAL